MIVLPNTPPTPIPWKVNTQVVLAETQSLRASLCPSSIASHSETVRYVSGLQEYLEALFQQLNNEVHEKSIARFASKALDITLTGKVPWRNVEKKESKKLFKLNGKSDIAWTLAAEIQLVTVSLALLYIKLGAELANELIDSDSDLEPEKEIDEKWKAVAVHYKRATSFSLFGSQFTMGSTDTTIDPRLFVLVDKCSQIGIQMSILSKFSWLNRNSYNLSETFVSSNNNILCRVSIFVLDEVTSCINLVRELDSNESNHYRLHYDGWIDYLSVVRQYATAYAGLFLSIEYYKKDSLGHAIGLINFSLLSLQSKSMAEIKPSKMKILNRFKTKVASKRNEHFVQNLNSVTSLRIDKSVFLDLSGLVLEDLKLLFDQLVQCHLKYTKENDNLKFEPVVDWKDVHGDSRWPFGNKIPVSTIEMYSPKVLLPHQADTLKKDFTGRGSYF